MRQEPKLKSNASRRDERNVILHRTVNIEDADNDKEVKARVRPIDATLTHSTTTMTSTTTTAATTTTSTKAAATTMTSSSNVISSQFGTIEDHEHTSSGHHLEVTSTTPRPSFKNIFSIFNPLQNVSARK